MTGTNSMPRIQFDLIPDCVRESIGNTLCKRFMENIRDPETKRRYDELGAQFIERWNREHPDRPIANG